MNRDTLICTIRREETTVTNYTQFPGKKRKDITFKVLNQAGKCIARCTTMTRALKEAELYWDKYQKHLT